MFGAISSQHVDFLLPLELREALNIPHDRPSGPYVKRSAELVEYAKGLQALPVPERLSVDEAASMFEIWMKDNALHSSMSGSCLFLHYAR